MGLDGIPLAWLSRVCAPVLTYHAAFWELPPGVAAVDNVNPEWMYEQVSLLKRHFQILSIDEFCLTKTRKGIAAITFDDGYQCVIDNALPVFTALSVPFTIFVNSSSMLGKPFWRHKLVYLENSGLAGDFEASLRRVRKVPGETLHTYSKNPANPSAVVEEELDRFLAARGITFEGGGYLFDEARFLTDHPLVWYGNHSEHHYVLSSLSRAEQDREIRATREFLEGFRHIKVSSVFAAPFGQRHHINGDTLEVLRDLGYRAVLLNRSEVNPVRAVPAAPVEVLDRVHAEEGHLGIQLKKAYLRTYLSRRRNRCESYN